MALTINTNIASLDAQKNLSTSQASLNTSLQRLSSGLRINSAKDDAAGLAISQRFQAQINGDNQAARNANDGISLAQTAEGGLQTQGDLLQTIRTLAVQAANGTNSDSDRASIQTEVASLTAELNRVANTTQFNGQNVLDGSLTSAQFQVGANANQTINVGIQSSKSTDIGNNVASSTFTPTTGISSATTATTTDANGNTIGLNNVTAQTMTMNSGSGVTTNFAITAGQTGKSIAAEINSQTSSSGVSALATTTATLSNLGTGDGTVQFTLSGANSSPVTISANVTGGDLSSVAQAINAQTASTNVSASVVTDSATGLSTIVMSDNTGDNISMTDTNPAGTTDLLTAGTNGAAILTGGQPPAGDTTDGTGDNVGATFTAGGTATVGASLSFSSDSGFSLSSTGSDIVAQSTGSSLNSVADLDVSTVAGANKALLTIDSALNQVNSNRANLGAIQNRFTSTISNLQTTSENMSASQSRIEDTDFASETANLTRGQILQQAGTAILAQANSLPNGVLALLRG
jgi:flagellin